MFVTCERVRETHRIDTNTNTSFLKAKFKPMPVPSMLTAN